MVISRRLPGRLGTSTQALQWAASWALRLTFAFIAASLSVTPSRADGCSVQDLANAIDNTFTSLGSGACASACADTGGTGCIAAAAGGAALGGFASSQGQGAVDNLCGQLNTAISDINALQSWLDEIGVSASVADALGGVGDPISVAQCACDMEQGVGQLSGEASSCLQDAICGLQQDLGWGGCSCHPPTPQAVDCGQILGDNSNPAPTYQQTVANGTLVVDTRSGWDGHSYWCSPQQYCFCPSPMVLTKQTNSPAAINAMQGTDECGDPNLYCAWTYACQCPQLGPGQTTHAAAASGPLSQVCVCDNTHLPAVPPIKGPLNPTGSICPVPLTGIPCPNGQVYDAHGKCVPACTSKSQVMTPDGQCCDPTQVNSCGTCCPAGTTPNLSNGSCEPNQITQ